MFIVQEYLVAWTLAGLSLLLLVMATILNAIFAFSYDGSLAGIELLTFMAFATNILAICSLTYVISHYIPRVKSGSTRGSTALFWRFLGISMATASLAALLAFATLVTTTVRMVDLPERIVGRSSGVMLTAWFAFWGVSALLQTAAYVFLGWWTKRAVCSRSFAAVDLGFGIVSPDMGQSPLQPRATSESFRSQDPTLTSPPQTPTTTGVPNSFRLSQSAGKNGPVSSRTRLVHSTSFTGDSTKSSFDCPTGEPGSVDHPFDHWDTSSVTREVRTTLQSTPPVTRLGLETIPGSRPESPAKALDGPFLPASPQAAASGSAKAVERCASPSSPKNSISSPPSSPPNFSRPTSRQVSQPTMSSVLGESASEAPTETLIHPLFRSTSPHPAPIATAGSMVIASPLAGQSITPKTLTRMRSGSIPQQPSPLKEAELPPHPLSPTWPPSPSYPSSPPPPSSSPQPDSDSDPSRPGPGSPGPSIVEDGEVPPVIPGFVLSAGQRSSYVGYGMRKSVKSRPASVHSQADSTEHSIAVMDVQ